jgi:lysophospholipase L1-like esterase
MKRFAFRAAYAASLLVVFGLTLEATARLDDWFSSGVPFLAPPTAHEDLTFHDGVVMRGAPGAVHKKWKLNSHGFRGPEIPERPAPGVTRVMVLGASEAFGLYESKDMEFPAVLQRILETEGAFEVVNAAIPGMTLRTMKPYWEAWAARFAPSIVLIYPSPLFYLNMGGSPRAPGARQAVQQAPAAGRPLRLRAVSRIEDVFEFPAFLQRRRDARRVEQLVQAQAPGSLLTEVPRDLVEAFREDLRLLVEAIEGTGAACLIVTHAMRAADPFGEEDRPLLESARVHVPRATANVIAGFEAAAAQAMREYAAAAGVPLADAARELGGRTECFADLVHFTDEGAKAMARICARDLTGAIRSRQR